VQGPQITAAQFQPSPPSSWSRWFIVRLKLGVAAAIAWLAVAGIEAIDVPSVSLLVFVVPPFELALWLGAATLTVAALGGFRGSTVVRVVTAVGLLAATIQFNNWSVLDPRSYYWSHRWAFAAVAEGVRDGTIGASDAYYGELLPRPLRDLSTNGRAAAIGRHDGRPVVFLPEYLGIPDDAAGYVFYEGVLPADFTLDLYGSRASLKGAENLGDGWWYARPGD
jgi:energy-coupling factor transporter transmembrane protein EcfT